MSMRMYEYDEGKEAPVSFLIAFSPHSLPPPSFLEQTRDARWRRRNLTTRTMTRRGTKERTEDEEGEGGGVVNKGRMMMRGRTRTRWKDSGRRRR